ncbi:MAG: hypothetical protein AW07_04034 [Candidatus Accumulibacter sp. SK-11]|nr:MAG: hypothetical protein AW07_04034 [Candidatus Accumulibacter sp. SK-11]
MALRDLRPAGNDRLHRQPARELLCRHLAVPVHENDQRLPALILHDQRLDHRVFVDAEFAAAGRRSTALLVGVRVIREVGAGGAQQADRRRHRQSVGRHSSRSPARQWVLRLPSTGKPAA